MLKIVICNKNELIRKWIVTIKNVHRNQLKYQQEIYRKIIWLVPLSRTCMKWITIIISNGWILHLNLTHTTYLFISHLYLTFNGYNHKLALDLEV